MIFKIAALALMAVFYICCFAKNCRHVAIILFYYNKIKTESLYKLSVIFINICQPDKEF